MVRPSCATTQAPAARADAEHVVASDPQMSSSAISFALRRDWSVKGLITGQCKEVRGRARGMKGLPCTLAACPVPAGSPRCAAVCTHRVAQVRRQACGQAVRCGSHGRRVVRQMPRCVSTAAGQRQDAAGWSAAQPRHLWMASHDSCSVPRGPHGGGRAGSLRKRVKGSHPGAACPASRSRHGLPGWLQRARPAHLQELPSSCADTGAWGS